MQLGALFTRLVPHVIPEANRKAWADSLPEEGQLFGNCIVRAN